MTTSADIWEAFVRSGREVVTTGEVASLAKRHAMRPESAVRHLRRSGHLLPLFKGYYYVRKAEEIRLGDERHNPLELFAIAADAKGIGHWYFGLHTALRLNGMTHEDRREETVISDAFYRVMGVSVGGRRFIILKWLPELVRIGLVDAGHYRYSDPEKTVLDLAYLDFWRVRKRKAATREWAEHVANVDRVKIRKYLKHYPAEVAHSLEAIVLAHLKPSNG